ncbi:MAG: DUF1320 domain-containing protein [Fibrobacteria bacterium]
MAYCTLADLEGAFTKAKLRQLTDDESLGNVMESRVIQAITSADTLIDSYIRGVQVVPITGPQGALDRLRQLSTDFAAFYLYQRRRDLEMPEDIQKQYDRNVAYLRDIAAGKVLLDTPSAAPNIGGIFKSNRDANSRVFTSDTLGKY